uniref:G domain-containing protein n=1 Tax=Paramormyrops kingsleyae TaxID=1676925 RepID=A0A3B3R1Q2_9TELE
MGLGSSTETPRRVETAQQVVEQERKPTILDKPWRDVTTKTKLMQSLKEYKPPIDSVPQARILIIGVVSAGKSSFFNSINSIFRGNITSQAEAGEMATSLSLKVKAGRGGQPLAFLLCDTMGLEAGKDGGVKTEDIESILKGYVPDKYSVRTVYMNTCSESFLLMCLDVPLMVLLTKVDKACPLVGEDLKNVYRSCYIKDLVTSDCLGIPVSQVLPVKNYDHENVLDTCCDVLLLSAMQQMLNFADNYFDNFNNGTE